MTKIPQQKILETLISFLSRRLVRHATACLAGGFFFLVFFKELALAICLYFNSKNLSCYLVFLVKGHDLKSDR